MSDGRAILIGILFSYLPQHYRIISRRSSFGISPYFVLLGTTSATFGFLNILVLPRSAQDIECCKDISGFACFAGLLGIFQVGIQTTCFYIVLLLFVAYFPRATPIPTSNDKTKHPTFRVALGVLAICILHGLTTSIMALTVVYAYPSHRQLCANIFGILAAILSSIQYFPQIYTTFQLRRVGSLSIPMMCIQTPGSIVWAASLAARLGAEGWSTWGVYIVTAMLQGTLLAMAIYFEYINPTKSVDDLNSDRVAGEEGCSSPSSSSEEEEAEDQQFDPTEETPLLQDSASSARQGVNGTT
ncbi:hypothetical protein AJ80_09464 [Polytolypa hystricis UAMH7299]|uniref:PQ loop repeat protein n=1 Tax=Polytolypa hystricis (strain UAMH7299) TaxID=1447883 RepID=A0A2B7WQP9_POLH7|nr:hypothetical protein AJ80_09464 [Polytolypa hystricis UAMH7299]